MDQIKLMYLIIIGIGLIGVACTYWSQYRHRRHQHHRS